MCHYEVCSCEINAYEENNDLPCVWRFFGLYRELLYCALAMPKYEFLRRDSSHLF